MKNFLSKASQLLAGIAVISISTISSAILASSASAGDKLPFEKGKSALISRGAFNSGVFCNNHGCGVRRATDFATTENIKIVASRGGTILNSGCYTITGYGCFVMIKNDLGSVDTYAHMKENSIVAPALDQPVSQGQVLGEIGCTGNCDGQHVHTERNPANGNSRQPLYTSSIVIDYDEIDESASEGKWVTSDNSGQASNPSPAASLPVWPSSSQYASLGLKNYDSFKKVYRYAVPSIGDHFYTTDFSELGEGNTNFVREDKNANIDEWYVHGKDPFTSNLVTVFRYANLQNGDHHFTTNFNELGNGNAVWKRETDLGQIWDKNKPKPSACFSELYRYVYTPTNDHFITANFNELANGGNGWVRETSLGWVPTYQACKNEIFKTQVYRYVNNTSGMHFYTTDLSELGNGGYGYVAENNPGRYMLDTAGSIYNKPVYRYFNTVTTAHFYTTRWSELAMGFGNWKLEGVDGYVPEGSPAIYRYVHPSSGHFYTRNYNELGNGGAGYTRERDLNQQ